MSAAPEKCTSETPQVFAVSVLWDADARVWVATSEDVPGLVAEAPTIEALIEDVRSLVPELLELDAVPHPERIEISLTAERTEAIRATV